MRTAPRIVSLGDDSQYSSQSLIRYSEKGTDRLPNSQETHDNCNEIFMSVLNTEIFFSIPVEFEALCPFKTHEEKSHQGKTTMTMEAEVLIAA